MPFSSNHSARYRFIAIVVFLAIASQPAFSQFVGVSGTVGGSFPVARFSDWYSTGFGSSLDIEFSLIGPVSATLSTGYVSWPLSDKAGSALLSQEGLPGTLTLDGKVQTIPVMIGLQYSRSTTLGYSFIAIMTGRHFMKGTADGVYKPPAGTPANLSVSDSWQATGLEIRIGTIFPLDYNWHIRAQASYSSILDLKHDVIPSPQTATPAATPPQAESVLVLVGIEYRFE